MWYDVGKTLTHNSLINMVIGNRGCGKTYALKKKGVNDYLKKNKKFIYLRRYEVELDLIKQSLFNDININNEFDKKIEYKKDMYLLDGHLIGFPMSLSKSNYLKSASFPDVDLIIFDEFIIDTNSNMRYLKNEVRKFLDFYETIARMREGVKVFMLSNSLSMVNPYTLFWDIKIPPNKTIGKSHNNLVLCELIADKEFIEKKKATTFGKLIDGTEFANYSIDNKFILDNDYFIEKKTGSVKYIFTFSYKEFEFGVWYSFVKCLYYVSDDIDPSCTIKYSTTMEDHKPNMALIKRNNKSLFGKFITGFKDGEVRFESQKIKKIVESVIFMTL